ncbi:MAG: Ldh family oxidoreductase [Lentisphaerae bacterium]|jgi:L-2-hydroxycarboxylate dehydrogenase (NAD+)|nr:Ldh family oxidoreductase [Lentisphaerota bacterium]MBT4819690.1 Ldh family oxidoreductase [Lentisphaerota bacterium]MBT5606349.1 Ldh family oxidoreductase [Lentisphaerota bacterium]MBT7056796.1 Ldh family oxidoreductase [Lentisphaerota bacterium]MBT7840401.1 Ldh family oxidoreductase [Lentisphaerota bacterium]
MSETICWVPFDVLEQFMVDVFKALHVPAEDAAICANVLITADKRGIDSHGVNRLKPIYYDRILAGIQFPDTEIEVLRNGPTTAVWDGNHGMGHAISRKAMQAAIDKAKAYGMGMVAVRNSTHYGIAGYYALMAIENGMIGITGTNARPSVAPTFGVENMLGTNPLTIGFPTDEEFPFVLDCATSITQRGKIEIYERIGKDTPPGCVIGENGQALTDTDQILEGLSNGKAAFTALGGIGEETAGYKGYGYSTIVEILSAALQCGSFLKMLSGFEDGEKVPYKLGHFFMAIDTEAFLGLDEFKKTAGTILRELRNSRRMPGEERIYTAGEKEYVAWQERQGKGVPVNQSVQQELVQMRDELQLTQYEFPFETH